MAVELVSRRGGAFGGRLRRRNWRRPGGQRGRRRKGYSSQMKTEIGQAKSSTMSKIVDERLREGGEVAGGGEVGQENRGLKEISVRNESFEFSFEFSFFIHCENTA